MGFSVSFVCLVVVVCSDAILMWCGSIVVGLRGFCGVVGMV